MMQNQSAKFMSSEELLVRLRAVVGQDAVLTAADELEPYVTEWRKLLRGRCEMVVKPRNTLEVSQVLEICHRERVPVTPQGGNTGMVGGAIPQGGIVLSLQRLDRIRNVDPDNAHITAEAGCVLAEIQSAARDVDLFFPLSLGSEGSCLIGGNLSTNAGGNTTVRFGNARDLVLGLEVVLPNGETWDGLRALRKNNTGYDLKHLFIGAEGTLGVITAATLKLFPGHARRDTVLAALANPFDVLALFVRLRSQLSEHIMAFETFPALGMELALKHIAAVRNPFTRVYPTYALVETYNQRDDETVLNVVTEILEQAITDGLVQDAVLAQSDTQSRDLWRIRETIPEAQAAEATTLRHDVSVPVSRVPEFIVEGTRMVEERLPGLRVLAFGHIGDGNIHFNLLQPLSMSREAFINETKPLNRLVHDYVMSLDGSFSAEHGIGVVKREDMNRYRPDIEIHMMRQIKAALDPHGIMNPGKILLG
ncbi:MAG: FAD-binding oxidoreductase [Gammaproteobacteria bacterium]|nr:FAD-binding oxidoreductase [Gammaproteobacteria bacterium]